MDIARNSVIVMNNGEVIDLLSLVTVYDGRNPGEADLRAWGDAAERGRWTWAEASEAVKTHFTESTEWIMPGHVTQRIRRQRSEPPRSKALPRATPQPADDAHVRRVVQWFAGRLAVDRESRPGERRTALAVDCPHCGATAHSPCVQTTGVRRTRRAGNRPIEIPHVQRRTAYRATLE